MLTVPELEKHLEQISYRPGWRFSVEEDWEGHLFVVEADCPDAYDSDKTVSLRVVTSLPPMPDPDYFDVWIQWRLIRLEAHESREFLHRDGRPIFDPHAE